MKHINGIPGGWTHPRWKRYYGQRHPQPHEDRVLAKQNVVEFYFVSSHTRTKTRTPLIPRIVPNRVHNLSRFPKFDKRKVSQCLAYLWNFGNSYKIETWWDLTSQWHVLLLIHDYCFTSCFGNTSKVILESDLRNLGFIETTQSPLTFMGFQSAG